VIVTENLQVANEELAATIAGLPDAARRRFQKEEDQRLLATDLLVRKAVDRLVAIARGEAGKPPVAEAQEQPPATEAEEG
jgi:hypothetical protein